MTNSIKADINYCSKCLRPFDFELAIVESISDGDWQEGIDFYFL